MICPKDSDVKYAVLGIRFSRFIFIMTFTDFISVIPMENLFGIE